jgi:hypothetical protein
VPASVTKIDAGDDGRSPESWNSIEFTGTPQSRQGENPVRPEPALRQSKAPRLQVPPAGAEHHVTHQDYEPEQPLQPLFGAVGLCERDRRSLNRSDALQKKAAPTVQ